MSISAPEQPASSVSPGKQNPAPEAGSKLLTLGIDIGSASSKAVLLVDAKTVLAEGVVESGVGTGSKERVLAEVLEKAGVSWPDIAYTVATGYGRSSAHEANEQISEITCHARGVAFECPHARTIIDIGGQDAKAISILNDRGEVGRFIMNDKCAAGTGRFLENISRALQVPIEKMGEHYFRSTHPAHVSSTCAVFAESEVISLLAGGAALDDVIAGCHDMIAIRAGNLARYVGLVDDIVMTGGVSRDAGVVDAMSQNLRRKVLVAPNAQLTGALGAAVLAHHRAKSQSGKQVIDPHAEQFKLCPVCNNSKLEQLGLS
jgi:(R)-2-hydroxyacyl-CoA dehydratese activating ATPase